MQPDNRVTVRFQRLSPDSRSNMEGFLFQYACSGRPPAQPRCENSPVLLMTSNISQSAACDEHIATVLSIMIDGVLASKNGENGDGFLHKPSQGDVADFAFDPKDIEPTDEVVWQNRLDNRYDVTVFGSTAPYTGIFVLRDRETELYRGAVHLAYNAIMGPDAADVAAWQDIAVTIIDRAKSPKQRLDEALDRLKKEHTARIKRLRTAPNAGEAYQLAIDAFRYPETAVDWLTSPNAALNRKAPADIVDDEGGLERIKSLLENLIKTLYPLE